MKLQLSDMSRTNRVTVYKSLLRLKSLSRLELSRQLALSLPTVGKAVKSLVEAGLVAETECVTSLSGRKPLVAEPLPNARVAFGVDITKNHIGFAIVNLCGETLAHVRLPKKFAHDPAYYADISALAQAFIHKQKVPPAAILGTGIAVPGIVSKTGDALLDSHMLALSGPVAMPIPHLPAPCRLFNDASAACLAETWGCAEDRSFVFLCLSNSVGGAVVRGGKLLSGDNQRCAEFGHMTIEPDGLPCYCGQKGHYDAYGSALNLATYGQGRLENFFAALDKGDPEARRLFEHYLHYLTLMVCNLRMASDVDVVLGGYVGSNLGPYLDDLRRRVAATDTFAANNADYLSLCRRKLESSAVGAALHHIKQFMDDM